MADQIPAPIAGHRRSNWVRLRTLIVLRWIAVAGQLAAIAVARELFALTLPLGLCLLAIGATVIANLVAIFVYPESNKRLTELEVAGMLFFDICQLSALLYLTGGLHNPFALFILAPVTISATALQWRATAVLGAVAIALITAVAQWHVPLRTDLGFVMRMPLDFMFGFWVAIVIGVVFLAVYAQRVTSEVHAMSDALAATQTALAREQKLTDLGGVVAATAHELGTPLATIKLVSSELMEDLAERPEAREDARLIHEQADRCRDILRSMGRVGKEDLHLRRAPLSSVIEEAGEPHAQRGKTIRYDTLSEDGSRQPSILRRPEIVHGLRNLIQNAVDFAAGQVWVDATWSETTVTLRIIDDGQGFPPQVMSRLGDPFVRRRRNEDSREDRPGYEGMGLGLFIAKTLLERSGAELIFANARDSPIVATSPDQRGGAVVEVVWPRAAISPPETDPGRPLGENRPLEV